MRVACDIECNALNNATEIHCIVAKDIDNGTVYSFSGETLSSFPEFSERVSLFIFHNGISYDCTWIERLLNIKIPHHKVADTLVLSHLLKYNLDGGHSLEAWGDRLGVKKVGTDITDWSKFTPLMLERCKTDVEITELLYKFLMSKLDRKEFEEAIDTEHQMAWICEDMHRNGFAFDIIKAKELFSEIEQEVTVLDTEIKAAFPPKSRLIREVTPKLTKHGTISRTSIPRDWEDFTIISEGSTFSLVKFEEFNPTSVKQIIERFNEYGWSPVDRTDGYLRAVKERDKEKIKKLDKTGWKVNEANLATLSGEAPEAARLLVRRLMLGARLRTLTEWLSSYNPTTGRVHGRFNGIGTWTHRMAHKEPNLGNVAAEKSIKYNSPALKKEATRIGGRMRSLWISSETSYLVGTDMESAHLRIFAHLINDETFKKALLTGDKKDGTDPHSTNKRALGDVCADRDRAKTFIFTFLNGGGAGKTASIFGCSVTAAKEAIQKFIESYPGLKRFKDSDAKRWATRGYFIGPDGRLVVNDSDHHMLAGYLQNYEAVMMKKANIIWRKALDARGIKFKQVNLVHDEYVTEVYCTAEEAWLVGLTQAAAIRLVGVRYGLRCPMGGDWKVGKTWLEVH